MEDPIVTLPTAQLAKEKGFKGACLWYYDEEDLYFNPYPEPVRLGGCVWAPTQSLLSRWLREVHHIDVDPRFVSINHWMVIVSGFYPKTVKQYSNSKFRTYEEAMEDGFTYALSLIP